MGREKEPVVAFFAAICTLAALLAFGGSILEGISQ
jgi:hypothetical protein